MSSKGAIFEAVTKAVISEVMDPRSSLDAPPATTHAAAQVVAQAVVNSPEVRNITNTEAHWYQKRSFWSAIVSGAMVVGGPLLARYGLPINPAWTDFIVTLLTTVGGTWAGYLAVRAGTATKPLGT